MSRGNIILLIVIGGIVLVGGYFIIKLLTGNDNTPPSVNPSSNQPNPTPNNNDSFPPPPPPPPQETLIGKNVYAKTDGVSVYDNAFKLYKTAKKGEWVGKVYAVREDGFLKITADRLVYSGLVEAH